MAENEITESVNDSADKTEASVKKKKRKPPKVLWTIVFIAIAVVSIVAIVNQSASFSIKGFVEFVKNASVPYILLALLCMLGYIAFEGIAILSILRIFGYKNKFRDGLVYSSGDIYFSAITPSATGGQPASALFMKKNGIPFSVVTVTLIINLIMYTFAIIVIGIFSFIMSFDVFLGFSTFSRVLIIIGSAAQCGLAFLFILLLAKGSLLYKVGSWLLLVLHKMHLIRHYENKQERLKKYIENYAAVVMMVKGKAKKLIIPFLCNLIQRCLLITVTLLTYRATGATEYMLEIWSTQSYVILATNCLPIPGAMGIFDYVLLEGLGSFMSEEIALNLELLSRGFSFYLCILICGIITLISYIRKFLWRTNK